MELSPENIELLKTLPPPILIISAMLAIVVVAYTRVGKPFTEQMVSTMRVVTEQAQLSANMTAEAAAVTRESAESVITFQEKQIKGLQKMYEDAVTRWDKNKRELKKEIKDLKAQNLTKDDQIKDRDKQIATLLRRLEELEKELIPLKALQVKDSK